MDDETFQRNLNRITEWEAFACWANDAVGEIEGKGQRAAISLAGCDTTMIAKALRVAADRSAKRAKRLRRELQTEMKKALNG